MTIASLRQGHSKWALRQTIGGRRCAIDVPGSSRFVCGRQPSKSRARARVKLPPNSSCCLADRRIEAQRLARSPDMLLARANSCRVHEYPAARHMGGISTLSMTWITPLSAATSAVTTLASFTIAPLSRSMVTSAPSTVAVFVPSLRSPDMTLPETTW